VDYVLRGDSTEEPLLRLLEHVEEEEEPEDVENLTWRSDDGRRRVNPLTYVPENLDEVALDYGVMVRLVLRHRDLEGNLPYDGFMDYPFTALLTCKGCLHNCVTCGGSRYAFRCFFGRERPAFKSPERLIEEMAVVAEYFHSPIFLLGDLRQGGRRYAEEVLEGIKREGIDSTITLELFTPAPREYLKRMAECCSSFTLEISPESHDDEIRLRQGRPYTTMQMERSIEEALRLGCERFDVFFMIGLPGQGYASALESVEYSRRLLERLGDGRVHPFIAPLSPFLDPGSLAFEQPTEYGYRRIYTTLEEHREALHQPCWKLFLNYETDWMGRDEIAEATYEAMLRMNELKRRFGLLDAERAERVEEGLKLARWVMHRIDEINASVDDPKERMRRYEELRGEVERARRWTWEGKRELRVTERAGIRLRGVLKHLLGLARRL
jgi:B12-binding domain/radical SAM domain protein